MEATEQSFEKVLSLLSNVLGDLNQFNITPVTLYGPFIDIRYLLTQQVKNSDDVAILLKKLNLD